jgi:hypothetical protein
VLWVAQQARVERHRAEAAIVRGCTELAREDARFWEVIAAHPADLGHIGEEREQ